MRQLPALLLLATATLPIGAKWKFKEKRYDPVSITDIRQIAGRYVGIDPDFAIELRVSDDGIVTGTMRNFAQTSTLRSIRIDGAEFTAMVDGRPLHATFANRLRNGDNAFGLIVHDAEVQIDSVTLNQIFCRWETAKKSQSSYLEILRSAQDDASLASTPLSCSRAWRSVIFS